MSNHTLLGKKADMAKHYRYSPGVLVHHLVQVDPEKIFIKNINLERETYNLHFWVQVTF